MWYFNVEYKPQSINTSDPNTMFLCVTMSHRERLLHLSVELMCMIALETGLL